MDLIYTNAQREDQGVLMDYEMDLAFGQNENNFECTIASASHCCEAGSYLYMEGTEYGGIVDSIQSRSADKEVVYSGRTWHGILGSKVILPLQAGETALSGVTIKTTDSSGNSIVGRYLIISGDAHDCIRFILSRIGLSDMFTAPTTLSRINIDKYQFNRYTDAYSGIVQMLYSAGQKLKLTYTGGTVVLSSVDKLDYSHDEEFNSELVEFDVKKSYKKINHLVCLGSGKLENRMIVNLYADKDGNISQTQTQFGVDEYTSTFEYPNVESEEELISNGIEKMQALLNSDKISVDFDERMDDYDVGDTVGTFDAVTGLRIIATITKKIITIKNGQINIDISTDSNSSYSTGGESNTGRSDAVKSVNGMTGEVEITASDIGAVPTSRTVNGKALGADISLSAGDVGALPSGGTAADSSKLGGKAPEYYLQPRNLLDNGWWGNRAEIINQKGATSYTGTNEGPSCIDRWRLWEGCNLNIYDGYIEITNRLYQYFYLNTLNNTVHTLAVKKTDGTIHTLIANPTQNFTVDADGYLLGSDEWSITIGLVEGQYVWAALYEGSYTAETLPPYVPKGYSAELASCNSAPVVFGGGYGGGSLQAYPVGSIYMSVISTSPASLFGGTWAAITDRFLLGAGGIYAVGDLGGEAAHTLTANEMPSHKHYYKRQNWFSNDSVYDSSSGSIFSWRSTAGGTTSSSYRGEVESTGGGNAHNNMPPYLAVYMWKRVS